MYVEMALIVCLDANVRTTCIVREFAYSPALTAMSECHGSMGQNIIRDYLVTNPIHEPWHFGGIQCTFGNKPKPNTGRA